MRIKGIFPPLPKVWIMEYLFQFLIISAFYFLGELLHAVIPLPVPPAVYGLVLLFTALCTGIIKLEKVEKAADFLLEIMSVMFIPAAVGIVKLLDILADAWWKILLICVLTTLSTMAVTGHVAQGLVRLRRKKEEKAAAGDKNE